jgi:MerR family transcriptional regulator, light-induced transcriptional regulator
MPEEVRAGGVRIGELGRRVGVSDHLLRVWERRYGVLQPTRTEGGQRLYFPADESRIRRMQAFLADGLAPAQAASAALAEERDAAPAAERTGTAAETRQPETEHPSAGDPAAEPSGGLAGAPAALTARLVAFDGPGAQSMLDELLARYTVETVLRDVVVPCLRRIGERWAAGTVTIGAEHFASNLLRARLGVLAQGWGQGIGPRAVLACVPGEQHDLGLFVFGIVLHRRGWRVEYLGADTPVADIAAAVTTTAADLAVIAAADHRPLDRAAVGLAALAAAVPLALAGPGASRAAADAAGARLLAGDPVTAAETLLAPPRPPEPSRATQPTSTGGRAG